MEYLGFYGKPKVENVEDEIKELKRQILALENKKSSLERTYPKPDKLKSLIETLKESTREADEKNELIEWEKLNKIYKTEGLKGFLKLDSSYANLRRFLKRNKEEITDFSGLSIEDLEFIQRVIKNYNAPYI